MGTPLQKRSQVAAGAGGWGGESNITRSAWFDGSADHLDRTPSSASSDRTRQIWGCWIRRIDFSAAARGIFGAGTGATARVLTFLSTHEFYWALDGSSTATSVAVFRDTEWMHLVASYDGNETGNAERLKVYVNGVEIELTFSGTIPTTPQHFGDAVLHTIGSNTSVGNVMHGSLTQAFHIANKSIQNADHAITDFGESVTAGTNGSIWAPRSDAAIKTLVDAGGSNSFLISSAFGDGTDDSGGFTQVATGTAGGDMTSGGGVASAFDGQRFVSVSSGPNNASGTTGYVETDSMDGLALTLARVYRPNDTGHDGAAGSATITFDIETSATGAWGGEETSLGTTNVTDYDGGYGAYAYTDITLTGTVLEYVRCKITTTGSGGVRMGEFELFTGSGKVPNHFVPTSMSDATNGSRDTPSDPLIVWSTLSRAITPNNSWQLAEGGRFADNTAGGGLGVMGGSMSATAGDGVLYIEYEFSGSFAAGNGACIGISYQIRTDGARNHGSDNLNQLLLDSGDFSAIRDATDGTLTIENGGWTGTFAPGDTMGMEIDFDNDTIEFYKNGTSIGSPYTPKATLAGRRWTIMCGDRTSISVNQDIRLNVHEDDWTGTPSAGAKAWKYSSLQTPAAQGADLFNALLYTGDGTSSGSGGQSQTGVGFRPDFVWVKGRNTASSHRLVDSVRGVQKSLQSDVTNAQITEAEGLTSFDADGFTHGNVGGFGLAFNYVAWCSKLAGGTTTTNSDGDITVNIQSNEFMSVVEWANTNADVNIGHGLGSADLTIIGRRYDVGNSFVVTFPSMTDNQFLQLESNIQVQNVTSGTIRYHRDDFTSTTFRVGTYINASAGNSVCWIFKNLPGVCQTGAYVGNGNADGPFIATGMRCRWILIKGNVSSQEWLMFDTARDPFNNDATLYLEADTNLVEGTSGVKSVDFLANGFKIRDTSATFNSSGVDYYYLAIADVGSGSGLPPIPGR